MGDVNVHVNLRHMHILCYVTGLALDELQDEKSFGGHRSSLERPCGNVSWKKIPASFQEQIPVITGYRLKNTSKSREFEPILGHGISSFAMRKRHFLKKPSRRWRGFPPGGMYMFIHY